MINDALRLIRVFHNLKQRELAIKLGVSQSHLSELEGGQKQPTLETLNKYSEVFDIPVSSILFFAEAKDHRRTRGFADTIAQKTLQMLDWVDIITSKREKA